MGSEELLVGSGLRSEDMPPLQRAADDASVLGQRAHLRWTRIRIILVVIAAIAGVTKLIWTFNRSPLDFGALTAVVCFALALGIEVFLLTRRPEQDWYHGRAVAESLKTLAWRYSMLADPFSVESVDRDADSLFKDRIREIIRESPIMGELEPTQGPQITDRMRDLRDSSFEFRQSAYLKGRVDDQITWYRKKAKYNRQWATCWRWVMLGLEFAGIIGALLVLTRISTVSLDGILSSMIAGTAAWLEVKQFDNLSSAYALTATELQLVREDGANITSEKSWSSYVSSAEDAISREHTMWLARRTKPKFGRIVS